jgi:hypothetical protein
VLFAWRLGRGSPHWAAGTAIRALRRGRLPFRFTAELPASLRASVLVAERRDDAAACVDSLRLAAPDVEAGSAGRAAELLLGFESGVDPLRTHCPGPTLEAVNGSSLVAAGRAGVASLLRPRPRLRFRRSGRFGRLGYGGRRSVAVTLDLQRSRVRTVHGGGP